MAYCWFRKETAMKRFIPWKAIVVASGSLLLFSGAGLLAQVYNGFPYVDNRASTPAEGYARGMSDVVRSAGVYNLATSEAAINMTEAQRREIENRQQWTNAYFSMRQANRSYRATERTARPSMEQLVRYAQADQPQRLSPSELDSVNGRIQWPRLLREDEFAQSRGELEGLFRQWAYVGAASTEQIDAIRQRTDTMLAELQAQVRAVTPTDYLVAKRFIQSLAYEAQMPAR
jgi:hypothetical protein